MADPSCEEFESTSAELALGILDGHDRARLVAHAEQCAACRRRLLLLSETADQLLELVPSAEPPVGLESAVLARLQAARSARTARAARSARSARARMAPPRRRQVVAAIAVVAAALVAGALASVVGTAARPADRPPVRPGNAVVRAELTSAGRRAGQIVEAEGLHPWIAVSVDLPSAPAVVSCRLELSDGATLTMGSFTLDRGHGYWAVGLPRTSSPVVGANLYAADGDRLATSRLRRSHR